MQTTPVDCQSRNPFPPKNQMLKISQSIRFAYEVGIISSYSNRIHTVDVASSLSYHC